VVRLLAPATGRCVQLEGPQEVGGVLEVASDSENFMDQIFHTDDVTTGQFTLNDVVAGQRNATATALGESSFVDQVPDALQVRVSPGNVGLADPEHVCGSLVQFNEDSVVDLEQTEELQSLAHLGAHLVHTSDTDDKSQSGFSRDVEVSFFPGLAGQPDFIVFLAAVLLDVLLSTFEDLDTSGTTSFQVRKSLGESAGAFNLLLLPALKQRFGDRWQFILRHERCNDLLGWDFLGRGVGHGCCLVKDSSDRHRCLS